jgi:hypothetical protein
MVNTNTLAALSDELGIGEHLYLGKGIAKGGGRTLKSLLANAFEAVLGAVFLDAGYDAAYHYYLDRFRRLAEPVKDENFKGRLQQLVQERFNQTPYYESAGARGVGHRREYTAVVFAGSEALGTGHGPTKQEAEQDAARSAIEKILGETAAPARRPRARRRRRTEGEPEPAGDGIGEAVVEAVVEAAADSAAVVQPEPPPREPLAEPVAEPEVGGPRPEPEAVAQPEPEKKPRRRRAPRKKAEPAAAGEAEPAAPRSRQFGEPV